MGEEIWKQIPSCPGWLASNFGRICKPAVRQSMPNGGFRISEVLPTKGILEKRSGRYRFSVNHRTRRIAPLICEAFHGSKPAEKHECMHLDEDKQNDSSDNLAWGTRKENMSAPKFRETKRLALIATNPRRKLSRLEVAQIMKSRDTDAKVLAARYGIDRNYVYQLWNMEGGRG